VTNCIEANWISSKGRYVEEFERKFSNYCNCKYGVTTTNGTSSIHLALASIGLKKGDEVIVPAFTMIGSVLPIIYCGGKPVLVDCDPETWTIDVNQIESKISKKTKAILPVHIYGHPCDMGTITDLAKKNDLYVIEDAAEAHGAEYRGKKTGGLGDVGCFSFYANKIITCGEGGMLVTDNEEIAERAKILKNLSFERGTSRVYLHSEIGYNYRLTNLQAAVGLAQFERIDEFVEMRRRNARQ
jgi:perosamine synthetase